jgi:hypothetical protein
MLAGENNSDAIEHSSRQQSIKLEKIRTSPVRGMLPDLPHQLRDCFPITIATRNVELLDVPRRLDWISLSLEILNQFKSKDIVL